MTLSTTILIAALIIASTIDIRLRKIPNWLIILMLSIGLSSQLISSGMMGLANSAAGIAIGLFLFFPLYATGGMGAGDVKLLAAIGSFVGAKIVIFCALYTLIFGGILAVIYLIMKGKLYSFITRYYNMIGLYYGTKKATYITPTEGSVESNKFPYALAISLGTLTALLQYDFM